jgi:hypothetical protein
MMDQEYLVIFLQTGQGMALFLLPMLEFIYSEDMPASKHKRAKFLYFSFI